MSTLHLLIVKNGKRLSPLLAALMVGLHLFMPASAGAEAPPTQAVSTLARFEYTYTQRVGKLVTLTSIVSDVNSGKDDALSSISFMITTVDSTTGQTTAKSEAHSRFVLPNGVTEGTPGGYIHDSINVDGAWTRVHLDFVSDGHQAKFIAFTSDPSPAYPYPNKFQGWNREGNCTGEIFVAEHINVFKPGAICGLIYEMRSPMP